MTFVSARLAEWLKVTPVVLETSTVIASLLSVSFESAVGVSVNVVLPRHLLMPVIVRSATVV